MSVVEVHRFGFLLWKQWVNTSEIFWALIILTITRCRMESIGLWRARTTSGLIYFNGLSCWIFWEYENDTSQKLTTFDFWNDLDGNTTDPDVRLHAYVANVVCQVLHTPGTRITEMRILSLATGDGIRKAYGSPTAHISTTWCTCRAVHCYSRKSSKKTIMDTLHVTKPEPEL